MFNPSRFRAGKSASVSREGRSKRAGTGQVHSRRMGSDVNPPTGLSNIPAVTSVSISFTTPAGDTPTNFQYALSTDGGASYGADTAISPPDAVSPITISGLTANTAYVVKLRTVVDGEVSDYSATTSFTTLRAAPTSVEYLVVAGGGGGGHCNSNDGRNGGGGGGAGGYRTGTASVSSGTSYTVVVGAGGSRGAGPQGFNGAQGGASSVFSISSTGGGGGGHDEGGNGQNGGSGGGGPATAMVPTRGGGGVGSGTAGQGNNGGVGNNGGAGGGGGAGAAGSSRDSGGHGGVGLNWNSLGTFYAGGGGGGSRGGGQGLGGNGGGGNGSNSGNGFDAAANRGGGGGGGGNSDNANHEGGHGGSGIVIIRWSTAFAPASSTSMTGAVSYNNGAGGFHQYTFTGTSAITFPATQNSGNITI